MEGSSKRSQHCVNSSKTIDVVGHTRGGLSKIKHLVDKVGFIERTEILLFQPILHDFPLGYERLMHFFRVTRHCLPKLPTRSYEFLLSKSNPLNIRHLIPIKVILHSHYSIRKSGDIYLPSKEGKSTFTLRAKSE